jgi:hypothetical protein
MFSHNCIKCQTKYSDPDPEPYLCASCNTERLRIAAEVDAKLASRPKKEHKSDFGIALALGKTIPSAVGGQSTFVRASDLGITFN